MEHLIESTEDGVRSSGDPLRGTPMNSPFSIMARSIELEAQHDAASEGKDPDSLAVRLNIANQIAALRLTMYCQHTGCTQGELANQLGVTRENLNRIVNQHSVIPYVVYERLHTLELMTAVIQYIDRTKPLAEKDRFETLLSGLRLGTRDRFTKLLYAFAAVWGAWAWQDFRDSTGSLSPIPKLGDDPESLSAAIRKATAA